MHLITIVLYSCTLTVVIVLIGLISLPDVVASPTVCCCLLCLDTAASDSMDAWHFVGALPGLLPSVLVVVTGLSGCFIPC